MNKKIFLAGALFVSTMLAGFESRAYSVGEAVDRYISCSKPANIIYAEPYIPEYS